MELKFDKKRFRVKYCPCGKSNKDGKFVPYENQEKFGYCYSCIKTYLPNNDNSSYNDYSYVHPVKPKDIDLIEREIVKKSWNNYEINHFAIFLRKMFKNGADELIKRFLLGTTKANGVIFWQIDQEMQTRTGKIMAYNPNTGKRRQDIYPNWVHKVLELNMKQCFFGLHQLKTKPGDQDIHIVESEKTAVIMTYFFPNIIWLASGGSNGLNHHKFEALRGRNICLLPDQGKYELWNEQLERIQYKYPEIYFYPTSKDCEYWFEDNELEKGGDIADHYLITHKLNNL